MLNIQGSLKAVGEVLCIRLSRIFCSVNCLSLCAISSFCPVESSAKIIHRYAFDGFASEAIDSLGQKNGTFEGGAKLTGNGTIALDGLNDYVNLPGGLLTNLDDATLETWIMWSGPAEESWNRIFEFGKDDLNYLYLTPRTGSSPRHARFGIAAGGPERKVNAGVQLPGDGSTRNHLVVTFNGLTRRVTLFLDGQEQGETTATVPLKGFADDHAWLGTSHFAWVPPFQGAIHEFRIYDHTLSAEQVAKNFVAGPDLLPGPVIEDFSVDRESVHSGTRVNLSWNVSEGAVGTIDPGGIPVNVAIGTVEVLALTDTTYTL
ncbi:MAG: LamG domain-containing protein, partial [Opitutae bacterium]|nr:LamG domain-containing protein [Opitutae bacterium]